MENDVKTESVIGDSVAPLPVKSAQSSIDAKREARRKRILENSSNRLEKITGRPHTEQPPTPLPVTRDNFGEIPPINEIHEDPEIERDVYEGPSNLRFQSPGTQNIMHPTMETDFLQSFLQAPIIPNNNGNILFTQQQPFNFLQGPFINSNNNNTATSSVAVAPITLFETIIETKIHIAFISTIVYLLFATGNQFYTSNNVFLYLLLWELAEMIIIKPRSKGNSSLLFGLVFALLVNKINPKYKNLVTSVFSTMNKIFKDVAVFMFVFVCIHIGWQYFGSVESKTFIEILGK